MKTRQSAALERRKFFADPVMVITIGVLIVLLALFILYPLAMLLLDSVYVRETNMVLARDVVSGSADAGMGIYSAAKLYDLDFLPICIEEYDLIIPDHAWDTPMVQQMIATLKSDAFREKILSMGGYTLENPGEIIEF